MNNLKNIFEKYTAVVFFDTETTGLDADTCQIIELAAIRIEQTEHGTLRMTDSLTVYKDRRAYPHKLANAISAYKLEDKVQNSHRAIDDVAALFEVCKAMDEERPDLLTYVNIFGYNPKYGVSGRRIAGVTYCPQQFHNFMQAPSYTLPARCKREARS